MLTGILHSTYILDSNRTIITLQFFYKKKVFVFICSRG